MLETVKQKIEDFLPPVLETLDVDLVELRVRHQRKTIAVDVFVDKPEGGITIDECTELNKKLTQVIERDGWILGDYTVQVASPGIDRPLKTFKDFLRVKGREVRFHLAEPLENKLEYVGYVQGISSESVVIDLKVGSIEIPLMQIQKAVQVV